MGTAQGVLIAYVGIPSFVVTLAGLLGFQGLMQKILPTGNLNVGDPFVRGFARVLLPDVFGWVLALACIAAFAWLSLRKQGQRKARGLECGQHSSCLGFRSRFFGALMLGNSGDAEQLSLGSAPYRSSHGDHRACWVDHDVPRHTGAQSSRLVAILKVRGGWGIKRQTHPCVGLCHRRAYGGDRRYLWCVAVWVRQLHRLCRCGSLLLESIGAAVIGGTSLFGGRGSVWNAILGALVIGSLGNGLDLSGASAADKLMFSGAILLLAVAIDAVSRSGTSER